LQATPGDKRPRAPVHHEAHGAGGGRRDGSEGGVNKIRWTIVTVFANLSACHGGESIKFRISSSDADFTAAANARNSGCRFPRFCIAQGGSPVQALDLVLAGGGRVKEQGLPRHMPDNDDEADRSLDPGDAGIATGRHGPRPGRGAATGASPRNRLDRTRSRPPFPAPDAPDIPPRAARPPGHDGSEPFSKCRASAWRPGLKTTHEGKGMRLHPPVQAAGLAAAAAVLSVLLSASSAQAQQCRSYKGMTAESLDTVLKGMGFNT
jgi:hypothetical protein